MEKMAQIPDFNGSPNSQIHHQQAAIGMNLQGYMAI
jgi:hypothetical protein